MVKRCRDELGNIPSGADSPDSAEPEISEENVAIKYVHLNGSKAHSRTAIQCALPPHHRPVSFPTYAAYDTHYQAYHSNRCSECHKNLPTEHFLNLHIAENHDPLNEVIRAKGDKTYQCFVEACDKICSSPQKRRMHLVDKHLFPKNYDFFVVNDGLRRTRTSMLRPDFRRQRCKNKVDTSGEKHGRNQSEARKPTSAAKPDSGTMIEEADDEDSSEISSTDDDDDDKAKEDQDDSGKLSSSTSSPSVRVCTPASSRMSDDLEGITKSMSALKFIPPSVRFGRGRGRGGLSRQ